MADATELTLPAGSVDVLFSNWLLMYLSEEEVIKLASDALAWVRRAALSCCVVLQTAVAEGLAPYSALLSRRAHAPVNGHQMWWQVGPSMHGMLIKQCIQSRACLTIHKCCHKLASHQVLDLADVPLPRMLYLRNV